MMRYLMRVGITLGVAYSASYFALVMISPLPYALMDFNKDKRVSLLEAFSAMDVATRTIQVEGAECMEYYFLKDATGIAVECR